VERPSAKPKLGAKYVVLSGTFPHLEEGNGLDAGKAALKGIIASHGGIVDAKVQGRTNLLVIGNHPGRTKVRDVERRTVQIVHMFMLDMYLGSVMTFKELIGDYQVIGRFFPKSSARSARSQPHRRHDHTRGRDTHDAADPPSRPPCGVQH
jgi:hypothetical protein